MLIKTLLVARYFVLLLSSVYGQHVKRKGTTPIDVTKNKGAANGGKPTFTLEQLIGKWQEIRRTYKNNSPSNFTDTNFLHFASPSRVTTRTGNNQASIVGDAAIEQPGNTLLAAADVYTILSVTDSTLVLDDQEYLILTFKKTNEFWYETLGKLSVSQETYKTTVTVKLSDVMGKWGVYKKEAKPGSVLPGTSIIRYLKITQKMGENSASGEITYSQSEQSKISPCTIKISEGLMEIKAGEISWSLPVYKADSKELVFGNKDQLLYFAKPL